MAVKLPIDPVLNGRREAEGIPAKPAENSEIHSGNDLDELVAALYEDLRATAQRERRRAGRPLTSNTTAMINEAYLKLYRHRSWTSVSHFMAVAATAMRHVLVDAARARLTLKRDGGGQRVPLDAADEVTIGGEDAEILRLGDALNGLSKLDPALAQLVECRFFAGLDEAETGKVMGISERTVRRRWVQARAWLHREMQEA